MNFKKIASSLMAAAMLVSAAPAVTEITAPMTASAIDFMEFDEAMTLEIGKEIKGTIGYDAEIKYTFTVDKSGYVNFDYTEVSDGLSTYWTFYDENRERLFDSDINNHKVNTGFYFNAGTYFVNISNANKGGSGVNYTMTAKFDAVEETFPETGSGSNNDLNTANEIKPDTVYNGMLGLTDEKDVYKLTLDSAKTLCWKFESTVKDVDFLVYNSVGEEQYKKDYHVNEALGKMIIQEEYDFTAGTYYIVIDRRWDSNSGTYSLDLQTTRELGGSLSEPAPMVSGGDVNDDGTVDASDASVILQYYAYSQTGGDKSFADWNKK